MTFNPHEYAIGELFVISKALERLKFTPAHYPCLEVLALVTEVCPPVLLELVVCQVVLVMRRRTWLQSLALWASMT